MYMLLFSLTRDGSEVVVKVFVKNDPSLQLKPFEKRLHGELCSCSTILVRIVYVHVFQKGLFTLQPEIIHTTYPG